MSENHNRKIMPQDAPILFQRYSRDPMLRLYVEAQINQAIEIMVETVNRWQEWDAARDTAQGLMTALFYQVKTAPEVSHATLKNLLGDLGDGITLAVQRMNYLSASINDDTVKNDTAEYMAINGVIQDAIKASVMGDTRDLKPLQAIMQEVPYRNDDLEKTLRRAIGGRTPGITDTTRILGSLGRKYLDSDPDMRLYMVAANIFEELKDYDKESPEGRARDALKKRTPGVPRNDYLRKQIKRWDEFIDA